MALSSGLVRASSSSLLATLVFGILAGCSTPRDPEGTPADSPTPQPGPQSVSVRGSCCPDTDAGIYALMERHEATPERERPPEMAMWGYRMTSGLRERERIVVRDSASWLALWPRIVGSHRPVSAVPAVNFANEMLIVVSMGTRSSGGYVIAIDSVAVAGDSLRVVVREQSPGPRCGTTAALSSPAALARVDRSELPVSFVTREVVRDCT